jgi:hypothetical protein
MAKRVLYYLRFKGSPTCPAWVLAQYADRSYRTWNDGDRGFNAAVKRAKVARKRAGRSVEDGR